MSGSGRPRPLVDVRPPPSRLVGVQRLVDIGCAADRNTAHSDLPKYTRYWTHSDARDPNRTFPYTAS